MYSLVVFVCAFAFSGVVQNVQYREIDQPHLQLLIDFQRHAYAKERITVDKIGRPIYGIYYPDGRFSFAIAPLLAKEAAVIKLREPVHQKLINLIVYVRHQVTLTFMAY